MNSKINLKKRGKRMAKNKLTVIVPVYNVAEYLPKCLDSLIGQTLKDLKIICVNDGTTDNSGEILADYAKKDVRISVITKKNGGLSSARNAGLKECKTEFVMFCDSDDYYEPEMCEKMLEAISESESDLAICGKHIIYNTHEEMRESDENYYKLKYRGKNRINDELILNTNVSVLNKIFRMKIIQENKIEFPEGLNNEDFYFYNAYMSMSETAYFLREPLYNYVRRENSIMSQNFEAEKLSIDHLLVAEKLLEFYKKVGFIVEHTDLFWMQWVLSYWFSVEHSSKNFKKQIHTRAKDFAEKNFEKYPPKSEKVKNEVIWIWKNSLTRRVMRRTRSVAARMYKKVNIKYRQQQYINSELEGMLDKYDEMIKRIRKIEEEE